jgi:hypothetical protein
MLEMTWIVNEAEEERQTAREIKALVLVFIVGIMFSVAVERFYGKKYSKMATLISAFFVYLLIAAMIGRVIWNNYIIELMPFLRPARGFEYILGLIIFSGIVLNT